MTSKEGDIGIFQQTLAIYAYPAEALPPLELAFYENPKCEVKLPVPGNDGKPLQRGISLKRRLTEIEQEKLTFTSSNGIE